MKKLPLALILLATFAIAFLAGTWVAFRSASREAGGGRKVLYYIDPMHPAYKSEKPGIAPDCGMQLEPVYADGSIGEKGSAARLPGTAVIPPEKRQAIGIAVGEAERLPWTGTLRFLGRVTPDESRTFNISAASDIWVRKIFPPTTGSFVRKDEPLAAYFTGGFLAAANAYIYALDTRKRHAQTSNVSQAQAQNLDFQMRQAVGNLINMGVSESQIREMEKTGKVGELVEIRSPADGFILEKSISAGQFVPTGEELYRIADLGKVWILAETYENEGSILTPGMEVKATHPQTQKVFRAKVANILPQFDSQTRTMKVRLEAGNPGFALRPDMFVDLEIVVKYEAAISVPAEAVVDTGRRKTVFIDCGNGNLEPRRVETGRRFGDRIEITHGLAEGERLVISGTFLVDSESRMKAAAAGIYGESAKDPVCGMNVDVGKAAAAGRKIDYGGKTHYFCSEACNARFRSDPDSFLQDGGHKPNASAAMTVSMTHRKDGAASMKDPVCGMAVDPAEAKMAGRWSNFRSRIYYFCADSCKRDFDRDPGKFVR